MKREDVLRKGPYPMLIDGREVLKWSGDFKRLSGTNEYLMPDPKCLGVGGGNGGIIFHKAEVRAPGSVPVVDTTPAVPAIERPESPWLLNLVRKRQVRAGSLLRSRH